MKDSENIARLDSLRPKYEKFRDLKIRTSAELERAEADLKAARDQAIAVAGTDNEDEIRQKILENYQENTKRVDDFEAILNDITSKLNAIEDGI
jgi:BioD-like phosphotransacetylase family protein